VEEARPDRADLQAPGRARRVDTQRDEALRTELLDEINAAIKQAEALPPPPIDTCSTTSTSRKSWNLASNAPS